VVKQLRLLSLSLKNFKGIREFLLDTRGENAKVFGDNGTGKTTVPDAFTWLLFDKDSQNKKEFAIKTLDAAGNEIHNLEHEVEGIFLINGQQLSLKKIYKEKWTRKRGSATAEFTGHTTDYYIDGVPAPLKDYKKQVDSIVKEDIFKLLTSPTYFNEQVKWQDRRKTLLEICGDISDDEVIASNPSLSNLPAILRGKTIEQHRKIIADRRKKINEELDMIPVRIDEIQRSLPQMDGLDKEQLECEITKINTEIDDKMHQIITIKNGGAVTEKQKEIQEIELALVNIKREHESDSKDQVYRLKAKIQEEQSNVSLLKSKLEQNKQQARHNNQYIKQFETDLIHLRQEWHEINGQEFKHTDACECPTCGQALPDDQVTAAKEKALSQFNLKKSKKLEEITTKGKQNGERKNTFVADNEKLLNEYDKLKTQIEAKEASIDRLQEQLALLESNLVDITENPAYVAKLQEKQKLNNEIFELRSSADEAIQSVQSEIIQLKSNRDSLQSDLGKFASVDHSIKRIAELEQQQKELAKEFEDLELELYLTEEFIREKVNMLEQKINSKFRYARFNLFETQINGGLQEVCETTYLGVPYSSGLNNAARINVGLDIIQTLSDHFGLKAPIFVDNAEAVTKLIDIDTQVISLVVSEADKQLRVEVDLVEMKEAI